MSAFDEASLDLQSDMSDELGTRSATYKSVTAGDLALGDDGGAVLRKDVEMEDSEGVVIQQDVISIKSGLVKPDSRDTVEIGTDRWRVGQVLSDDGYIMKLAVRRVL